MSRAVRFEPDAWDDFNDWLVQDIKTARRIDKVNRLVYKVTDDAIVIISCKNHYE